jgi:3-oxoadipate enol-lactonase
MPFAPVRDIDLYYEIHGRGPPLLSISGTGADLRANPLRGQGLLEQHFTVLVYDQRGLGQSGKPDVAYTMADYADDAAALLDAVGWTRAHVVGVSFGGMVAQHLALRHPARVDRLVLACTSAGGAGGSSFDLLELDGLDPDARTDRWLPLLDTRNDPSTDPPTLAPGLGPIGAAIARMREVGTGDAAQAVGARRQLEARAAHDVWDAVAAISAPTLVIGGHYDGQAPPDNSRRLAARIPGARLALCDGGHVFLLQDPTAWPTIVDFLTAP